MLLGFALFNGLANLGFFLLLQSSKVADQFVAQLLLRFNRGFIGGQGAVRGRCCGIVVCCSFLGGALCGVSVFLPS
ncbi:MAG TPA: hypothetical protein DHV61_02390 [Glutamicibacter sp.]|nr:hypothetical protein [Glutamicibacter sp.]